MSTHKPTIAVIIGGRNYTGGALSDELNKLNPDVLVFADEPGAGGIAWQWADAFDRHEVRFGPGEYSQMLMAAKNFSQNVYRVVVIAVATYRDKPDQPAVVAVEFSRLAEMDDDIYLRAIGFDVDSFYGRLDVTLRQHGVIKEEP